MPDQFRIRREKGKIWSHVRQKWLNETPEESVRQEYLCVLVNEYGFSVEQIDEEVSAPGERGTKDARADFVIWRTIQDRRDGKTALIVIECKADNVTIDQKVYVQGANYAQYERAKFFVTHNRRSTKFWKVELEKRAPNYSEVKDIPHASDSGKGSNRRLVLAHCWPLRLRGSFVNLRVCRARCEWSIRAPSTTP